MLPASQTSHSRDLTHGYRIVVFASAMLFTYTLMVGCGLLMGLVPYESAYLLIAVVCLVPIATYAYGFLQVSEPEQDWGLLFSALGWAIGGLGLLAQHGAQQAQLQSDSGAVAGGLETSTLICVLSAMTFLAGGATLSLQTWQRERLKKRNARELSL